VYSPKVLAAIGGLSGPLLDRSIVVHMERMPSGTRLKSSRIRQLKRDSEPLVGLLEAYGAQYRERLQTLYDLEPDEGYWPEIEGREGELWGPLLINARIAGHDTEKRLLAVARSFMGSKADIELDDRDTAKAAALVEVLSDLAVATFSPGDLIDALAETEAWATTFSGDDKARRKVLAAKVGYFLRDFRIEAERTSAGKVYDRAVAMNTISTYLPENHARHTQTTSTHHTPPQPPQNTDQMQGVQSMQGLPGTSQEDTQNHAGKNGHADGAPPGNGLAAGTGPRGKNEDEDGWTFKGLEI
jgi:hypothetical protein